MPGKELVTTRGNLDVVALEGGTLRLDGWVASAGAGPLESVTVSCGGRELPGVRLTRGLPSKDVKAVHPNLDSAGSCRFQVRVPLADADPARVRSSVVFLTPRFKGQEGFALGGIPEPVLPVPSQEDIDTIGSGFAAVSLQFLGYFVQLAGLKPTDAVLDVGCGVGRMAYALAHYLAPSAAYEGFDIVERLIRWCQQSITPRFPHFQFRTVDVANPSYNQGVTGPAAAFVFPYEAERFDFVFLTSVFTHMRGREVRRYLDEIRRVLKPGGRCLATFFLLNAQAERLIRDGKSTQKLVHPLEDGFTTRPDKPEDCIGFSEALVAKWLAERRLKVVGNYYGSWCGRAEGLSYQDMLVLTR